MPRYRPSMCIINTAIRTTIPHTPPSIRVLEDIAKVGKKQIVLVASGDLRLSANQVCWPAQNAMEQALAKAIAAQGFELVRAHPYDASTQHGFIQSQRQGIDLFAKLDPEVPLIVAEAVVAILASLARRADDASRADFDRGQLVGPMARFGWDVEPERFAAQKRECRSRRCGAKSSTMRHS